jgi:hypothetical protein
MIRQGLDTLNQALIARVAAQSTGEQFEYTPPSESKFAASVAKDMAGDVLSSSRMKWIAITILIIIIIVAVIWMNQGGG